MRSSRYKDVLASVKSLGYYTLPFLTNNDEVNDPSNYKIVEKVDDTFKGKKNLRFFTMSEYQSYRKKQLPKSFNFTSSYRSCEKSIVAFEKMIRVSNINVRVNVVASRRIMRNFPDLLNSSIDRSGFNNVRIFRKDSIVFVEFLNQRFDTVNHEQKGRIFEFFMNNFTFKDEKKYKENYCDVNKLLQMDVQVKNSSEKLTVLYSGETDSLYEQDGKISSLELKWLDKHDFSNCPEDMKMKWKKQIVFSGESRIGFGQIRKNDLKEKFTVKKIKEIKRILGESGGTFSHLKKKDNTIQFTVIGVKRNIVTKMIKNDSRLKHLYGYKILKSKDKFLLKRLESNVKYSIKEFDNLERYNKCLQFSGYCIRKIYNFGMKMEEDEVNVTMDIENGTLRIRGK